ncbi:hypothetical protein Q6D67_19985 [Haliea sp. E1-2-M8]|uniref:hypothetical protein n=1 Tax=Haliea sp. E1-2-M8 TaxID=3064706 RepID=UPI00271B06C1|nr:hypothetical protein [Haliea sp. E1-2-M8]MDO8863971.1 hypothetical protein [Haliea sp. E1-2-M8]
MNVGFEYLYRDAGNNKLWGFVVFANKRDLSVAQMEKALEPHLIDGQFFPASPGLLPPLQFPNYDDSLDHDWLEYSGMEVSKETVNDPKKRDISDFVDQLIELSADFAGD